MGKKRFMRILQRPACIVLLVLALLAGCGGDDDDTTTSTIPAGAASTTVANASDSVPSGVVQGATDGANCSPQGARGLTKDGISLLCTLVGGETKWRPA